MSRRWTVESGNIPIIPSTNSDPAVIQAAVTQVLASHPTGVYADLYYPEGALVADDMLAAPRARTAWPTTRQRRSAT